MTALGVSSELAVSSSAAIVVAHDGSQALSYGRDW